MTTDLLVDGMLSGTGLRDAVNGGYLVPATLGLPDALIADLAAWLQKYEEAHFAGFPGEVVAILDEAGVALASRAEAELSGKIVGYYSNARMKQLIRGCSP